MDMMKKIPVREQDLKVRATNFQEVCYGYNEEEAVLEASRCLNCKNARCIAGCPVKIDIPTFISQVKEKDYLAAANTIAKSSALPAGCGRVCPQESQCEGQCVRGIKGEAISIGKLERFVADWAREHGFVPEAASEKKGKKVAVIGGGMVGCETAEYLAERGCKVSVVEMMDKIANGESNTILPPLMENYARYGVEQYVNHKVSQIALDHLLCEDKDRNTVTIPCD